MDEIRIGYFLEDIGQERFLTVLVNRIAQEMGLVPHRLRHEVRNATGGRGTALSALRRFLRDVDHEREGPFALLVVAIDGDCHSYRERRDEIRAIYEQEWLPLQGVRKCKSNPKSLHRSRLPHQRGQQAFSGGVEARFMNSQAS